MRQVFIYKKSVHYLTKAFFQLYSLWLYSKLPLSESLNIKKANQLWEIKILISKLLRWHSKYTHFLRSTNRKISMTLFLSACYLEIKYWFAKCQINTAVHMCSLDCRLHAQLCLHGPNQLAIALGIVSLTSAEALQGLLAKNLYCRHI